MLHITCLRLAHHSLFYSFLLPSTFPSFHFSCSDIYRPSLSKSPHSDAVGCLLKYSNGNFSQGRGTFVPLPHGKVQQSQQVNLGLPRWYHWHKSMLISAGKSGLEKGCCTCCGTNPVPLLYAHPVSSPPSSNPFLLYHLSTNMRRKKCLPEMLPVSAGKTEEEGPRSFWSLFSAPGQ